MPVHLPLISLTGHAKVADSRDFESSAPDSHRIVARYRREALVAELNTATARDPFITFPVPSPVLSALAYSVR